ncbi:MAG TPA: transposase [Patescibacteria group bacterium]|nr:transposase [Patescibacteria group bacterium]
MDNNLPNRKDLRIKNYDYSQAGYYFVTICTEGKEHVLGDVVANSNIVGDAAHSVQQPSTTQVKFTQIGHVVEQHLNNINAVYSNAKLDCYVVMPNHVHFIVIIEVASQQEGSGQLKAAAPTSLPKIINSFKTITSKKYGKTLWQRNYYEHIIRNDKELHEIRGYIVNNPAKWELDQYYNL